MLLYIEHVEIHFEAIVSVWVAIYIFGILSAYGFCGKIPVEFLNIQFVISIFVLRH